MRIPPLAVFGVLLALVPFPSVAAATADADYAAFAVLREKRPPASPSEMGLANYFTWIDRHLREFTAAGREFLKTHPADARRWEVALAFTAEPPIFARSFGPDVDQKGIGAADIDVAARTAWEQEAERLWAEILVAEDSSLERKHQASFTRFAFHSRRARLRLAAGEETDARAAWDTLVREFDEHARRFAGLPAVGQNAADFIQAWKELVPDAELPQWRRLAQSMDPALRDFARTQVDLLEGGKPMELAFTAVDGRAVDLAKLRGKVVLVDFWATWCGPCKMELPNVKAAYEKYHERGFEVVAISLDSEKDKQKLIDYCAENHLPWPQHFDGKGWKNELAVRFAISAIPAMFLLDQQGKVVTTDARGPKLEAEVNRLLGL